MSIELKEWNGMEWKMKGVIFKADFYLMPLSGCDIVLEKQWFSSLGKVLFDFEKRTIEFDMHGRHIMLRGSNKQPIQIVDEQQMVKTMHSHGELSMLQIYAIHETESSAMHQLNVSTEGNCVQNDTQQLLDQYAMVFKDPVQLPRSRPGFNHKNVLKKGSNPVNLRPYKYPLLQKDVIEQMKK